VTWSTVFLVWRLARLEYRIIKVGFGAMEWAAGR
jgi:hypothetical protein